MMQMITMMRRPIVAAVAALLLAATTLPASADTLASIAPGSFCVLYLRIGDYESSSSSSPSQEDQDQDNTEEPPLMEGESEVSWTCAFPYGTVEAQQVGGTFKMTIDGLSDEYIESQSPVSGGSLMTMEIAGNYANKSDVTGETLLVIQGGETSVSIHAIPEDDDDDDDDPCLRPKKTKKQTKKGQQPPPPTAAPSPPYRTKAAKSSPTSTQLPPPRSRRRQLSYHIPDHPPVVGTYRTLVVRVVDNTGSGHQRTVDELRNDVFDDSVCLKSRYEECSHDQLMIEPTTAPTIAPIPDADFEDGVIELEVNIEANSGFTTRTALEQASVARAEAIFGDITAKYDLVLFCLPFGSIKNSRTDWIAFAHMNSYDSFYNADYCGYPWVQMHEVGHSLGLSHSGEGVSEYGDASCMMGSSTGTVVKQDDAPRQCFNAAKNFQLGWFYLQAESFNPLHHQYPATYVMAGTTYAGSRSGYVTTMRLVEYGDDPGSGADYYVGYNFAGFPNVGTVEVPDKVLVFAKPSGGPYGSGTSWRLAALSDGESHTISNFQNSGHNVSIAVEVMDYAIARIVVDSTQPPPDCSGDAFRKFRIEIRTDIYGNETSFRLREENSRVEIAGRGAFTLDDQTLYTFPSTTQFYCLTVGSCYLFEIFDTSIDGIQRYGPPEYPFEYLGYYTGFLDSVPIFSGGDFFDYDSERFCVDAPGAGARALTALDAQYRRSLNPKKEEICLDEKKSKEKKSKKEKKEKEEKKEKLL